jgi:hypothetical protein
LLWQANHALGKGTADDYRWDCEYCDPHIITFNLSFSINKYTPMVWLTTVWIALAVTFSHISIVRLLLCTILNSLIWIINFHRIIIRIIFLYYCSIPLGTILTTVIGQISLGLCGILSHTVININDLVCICHYSQGFMRCCHIWNVTVYSHIGGYGDVW